MSVLEKLKIRLLKIPEFKLQEYLSKDYIKSRLKEVRQEMDPLSWVQLTLVSTVFMLFMIIPLISVAYTSFLYNGSFSLEWFRIVFTSYKYMGIQIVPIDTFPYFTIDTSFYGQFFELSGDTLYITGINMGVILNSLFIAIMTTFFSTIFGVSAAYIMARYKFPLKAVFSTMLIIPLLSTPFVGSIGVKRMLQANGVVNILLYDILHIIPYRVVFDGLSAIILVQTLHFFTLVYLNAYTSFVNIDPSLEEQAENLGARGFKLFRTVTLPLALPGIQAGAILTFILSIEDVGTPIIFQSHTQARYTLAYQVYSNIFSPTGEINPIAPTLGTILLVFAILGFLTIRKYVALRNYGMLSKGGIWNPRVKKPSNITMVIIYTFLILLLAVSLIPHIGVFLLSISLEWLTYDLLPARVGLDNFIKMFTLPDIAQPIYNSLFYTVVATTIIVILATGAAYIIARKNIPLKGALDVVVTMPIAIPGIVIAIGYFTTFLYTPLSPLINPVPLLIFGYAVRRFTFTVRAAYAGLLQTHEELEEVSLNLGANRTQTFFKIVIPLIGISVLAGAMMSFVYAMAEVSLSIILGGTNPDYAPITWKILEIWSSIGGYLPVAAALGMLLMISQAIAIAVVNTVLRQRASVIAGL